MKPPIEYVHRLRQVALRVLRVRTRGVKAMVFDANGAVLLIRNRYGDTESWVLPGGGIARGEKPVTAARREVLEETGCRVRDIAPLAVFTSDVDGHRDTVHLFRATTRDTPVADAFEVSHARFFALDALPDTVSPATRRRIAEWRGERTAKRW